MSSGGLNVDRGEAVMYQGGQSPARQQGVPKGDAILSDLKKRNVISLRTEKKRGIPSKGRKHKIHVSLPVGETHTCHSCLKNLHLQSLCDSAEDNILPEITSKELCLGERCPLFCSVYHMFWKDGRKGQKGRGAEEQREEQASGRTSAH